ncbi:MAG: hypothetical protein JST40_03835 [Armatimonadetes bacterium]|nr:hypothetical protein [Armatimonadota bacterium]
MNLLALQWSFRPEDSTKWTYLIVAAIIGFAFMFALSRVPTRMRRVVVGTFTFLSGLFYVLLYIWPQPIDKKPLDIPQGPVESVGFLLQDMVPVVKDFTSILTAFLLGLGVYSLLRVHIGRVARRQRDWQYSGLLLLCMATMLTIGYWDFFMQSANKAVDYSDRANWTTAQYGFDLLFDGMLQQMDAAMFSIIAFFILSAAYRAFRIRSIEATIMLGTALILMLSLMGIASYFTDWLFVQKLAGGNANAFVGNFTLAEISNWIKNNFQVPSLRAMEFGIGIGALAMGLRIWLSLERGGVSA